MDRRFFETYSGLWSYVVRDNTLYQYCAGNLRGRPIECASYEDAVDMAVRFATP